MNNLGSLFLWKKFSSLDEGKMINGFYESKMLLSLKLWDIEKQEND